MALSFLPASSGLSAGLADSRQGARSGTAAAEVRHCAATGRGPGFGVASWASTASSRWRRAPTGPRSGSPREATMFTTTSSAAALPFQPSSKSPAQLAAVSFLARYSGATHALYRTQLGRWFAWCEANGLDPLIAIQRAHVELYIRELGEAGLMDSSVNTMMHAVRGYFRFAHIHGTITADPAVYTRLPKIHRDEPRTQGLDRLGADPLPPGRPDHHRPPRRAGLPARDQRTACLRGRSRAHRGLHRRPAGPPGAAPGRQGQQARHDAADRSRAAGPGSLPR
ncbi:site-specific integrase [Ornithinimicrobium sp. LYQ121]|uniref:site-specific integrase n=1 Tax=Ornithinimicrobium sp. LYQ121 TaxID=3378801 RepID=UPI0038553821